jgi:hypothetical protein
MTKFAPVLPAALIPEIDTNAPGHWHFVHAPQVKNNGALLKWLRSLRYSTIILDCFAYELQGQLPKIDDIYWVAERLAPTTDRGTDRNSLIIVVPDVVKDTGTTFELMRHAPTLSRFGRVLLVPHTPNGLKEWMVAAEHMIRKARHQEPTNGYMIGLPRYMHEWNPTILCRRMAAIWLHQYYPEVPVHLLGSPSSLVEMIKTAAVPNVVSADSTSPFTYGLEHGFYHSEGIAEKYEMASSWWELNPDRLSGEQIYGAKYNIAVWKERLDG